MNSSPPSQVEPAASNPQGIENSASERPAVMPLGTYYATYFTQAVIMSTLLMNMPVFLRQGVGLDWLGVTASYLVMFVPVLLRPLFAWVVDRRPALLALELGAGVVLVVGGSIISSIGASTGTGGIIVVTLGFSIAVVGATLMNVAADSHLVRAVPLDQSAHVNSFKRLFAFLGITLGQLCYLVLVGAHYTDFPRWMGYFAVPAIAAAAVFLLLFILKKGTILPSVAGLPPRRAPWLSRAEKEKEGTSARQRPAVFGIVLAIAFLFLIPEGLIETTFENFIVDTYGDPAWLTYSTFIMLGGVLGAAGYLLAGRSGKRAPEWDLLWYMPVAMVFYAFLGTSPAFPGLLWATIAASLPSAFIQVRLLQSWQGHAYSRRPGLVFQVFMATYALGKAVGIGISGWVMTVAEYAGIFSAVVIVWVVGLGLAIAYRIISK